MRDENKKMTEAEFDASAKLLLTYYERLKPKFESLYIEALALASKINGLSDGVESNPDLLVKLTELSTRPDMAELSRLLIALMYVKNPTDIDVIEQLSKNIRANSNRRHTL